MNWIQECNINLSTNDLEESEYVDFSIEDIPDIDKINKKYNVLTEFYISLTARFPNSRASIFLNETKIPVEILESVVAHFDNPKVVTNGKNPIKIILKNPKTSSVDHILKKNRNPIIEDLFDFNKNYSFREWTPPKTYKIVPDTVEKYENDDFDSILPYLYMCNSQPFFIFSIDDWVLNDSLKNSLAIRYFTHKFKEVYLWVDDDKNVTNIQLAF